MPVSGRKVMSKTFGEEGDLMFTRYHFIIIIPVQGKTFLSHEEHSCHRKIIPYMKIFSFTGKNLMYQ